MARAACGTGSCARVLILAGGSPNKPAPPWGPTPKQEWMYARGGCSWRRASWAHSSRCRVAWLRCSRCRVAWARCFCCHVTKARCPWDHVAAEEGSTGGGFIIQGRQGHGKGRQGSHPTQVLPRATGLHLWQTTMRRSVSVAGGLGKLQRLLGKRQVEGRCVSPTTAGSGAGRVPSAF